MHFIKLTYFKPTKNYGTGGGQTTKEFYLAVNAIVRITEYTESVKLSLVIGEDVEVCEKMEDILQELRAVHVHL